MSRVLVISDPHYLSAAEEARGDYEPRSIPSPALRLLVRAYRHFVWMRNPALNNALMERFLAAGGPAGCVVVNGDLSCDSGFVGVSDEAAFQSARQCLDLMRARYGPALQPVIGDHELGKMNLIGGRGGLRLASWRRAVEELGMAPCWQRTLDGRTLAGVTSSLVALPVFEPELLPDERQQWKALREAHLAEINRLFEHLPPGRRILLFCHDPTALPYLAELEAVAPRLADIDLTIIGHLHSSLLLWKSRRLSGIPPVNCLGNTLRRYTSALSRARAWRPFHVRLCPALSGIQLLDDGGWLSLEWEPAQGSPVKVQFHRLGRRAGQSQARSAPS